VVALLIVVLPSGGKFVVVVGSTLKAGFLAALALAGARLYRSQSEWFSALSDRDRGLLYGAGAIALLAYVADLKFKSLGSNGTIIEYAIYGVCAYVAYWVWRGSKRYSF
jgi:hypothetical protein